METSHLGHLPRRSDVALVYKHTIESCVQVKMGFTYLFASVPSASSTSSGCKGKTIGKDDIASMETLLAKFAKGRKEHLFVAKIHCHKLGDDDDLPNWKKGMLQASEYIPGIEAIRNHFSVEAFYEYSSEYAFSLEHVDGGIIFSDDKEKVEYIYASNIFLQK